MQTGQVLDLTDAPPRRAAWWPAALVWTSGTLLYATALHLQKARLPFSIALRQSLVFCGTLAVTIWLVSAWDARQASRRRGALSMILSEIVLGLAAIAVWQGLVLLDNRLEVGPYFWRIYTGTWMFQLLFDASIYVAVRGLMLAASLWQRDRERERREAALLVAARDLELSVIRTQFQPHFVLNALNSLLALIDDDPALARTMVVRLADLMTAVFDRGDVSEEPLERGLDLVRAYLDVERVRLGDRLRVTFDVEDAARDVPVPPFLLQPIVENAVKHGIAPYARPGVVTISARVGRDRLHVAVSDATATATQDTDDTETDRPAAIGLGHTGRGLQITRRRLETAYGGAYALTLERAAGGTVARVEVPIRLTRVA
jgi:hypothetical protein